METRDLTVRQTRLFSASSIKVSELLMPSVIRQFLTACEFAEHDLVLPEENASPTGVRFKNGEFRHEGRSYPIEVFAISPRAIRLAVTATSEIADACMAQLASIGQSALNGTDPWPTRCLARIEENTWVGVLQIDPSKIFQSQLLQLMQRAGKTMSSDAVTHEWGGLSQVAFRFGRTPVGAEIAQLVDFPETEFRLEPLAGSPASESLWYVESAFRTNELLAFLNELEVILSSK